MNFFQLWIKGTLPDAANAVKRRGMTWRGQVTAGTGDTSVVLTEGTIEQVGAWFGEKLDAPFPVGALLLYR